MKKNYIETTIPEMFKLAIAEDSKGATELQIQFVLPIVQTIMTGIADYAKVIKKKDAKKAITITDYKDNLLLGAVIRYDLNEGEEENEGNWEIDFTFDENDLTDCQTYPVYESQCFRFFDERAKSVHIAFSSPHHIATAARIFAQTLRNWLDANAKEDEEVSVDLPNYFRATVSVNSEGVKEMSFVADGAIKRLVKDDEVKEA